MDSKGCKLLIKCGGCGKDLSHIKVFPYYHQCGYRTFADGTSEKREIPVNAPPNILQKGINYAKAWIKWKRAGKPKRYPNEIRKLRRICAACKYIDEDGVCTHRECGCSVSKAGIFGDKLKWKTEECPIGNWPEELIIRIKEE
ncbi:MAG: hypothetical protein GTO02_16600 [Candidatus Dadabacteria bacterium]|nr:hypothetical protein [Candidatus Dadabacteria bacterium]